MRKILTFIMLCMVIIYADNNIALTNGNIIIKGHGEECSVSLSATGKIVKTNCLQLTNSKKVKILCTKNKKMCKTVSEIKTSLFNSTYQTSYNCDKAVTQTEKDICNSRSVSTLDYKLGNNYLAMKKMMSADEFTALIAIQKEWIENRELKCGKFDTFKKREACILDMYNKRLDSFSLMSVSNNKLSYNKSFDEVYSNGTTDERFDLAGFYYYKENNIARATKLLRKVVGNNDEDMFSAFMALNDMHKDYAKTFEGVTKELLNKYHNSIAMSLIELGELDHEKIRSVFLKEAYYLDASAEIMLAIDYRNNLSDQSYKDKILSFYSECADDGVPRCQSFIGEIYLKGEGVKQDIDKGISLLENANLDEAYFVLGNYYFAEKNIDKSKKNFKLSAEMKHVGSIYNLGVIAQNEKNYKQAVSYFKAATDEDNNYYPATFELGRMYIEGWGVEKDYLKAIDMLTIVADNSQDQGLVEFANKTMAVAELFLGNASEGREAFKWYEKSAIKNNMYAQYELANMYFYGNSVEKDIKQVVKLYEQAAVQGYSVAQLYLGLIYIGNKEVKEDEVKAKYWLKKSAQNGNSNGQMGYGLIIEGSNKAESLSWIKKAAAQGNEIAIEYLNKKISDEDTNDNGL